MKTKDIKKQLEKDIEKVIKDADRANELDIKRLIGNITDEEYEEFLDLLSFSYLTIIKYSKYKLGRDLTHEELEGISTIEDIEIENNKGKGFEFIDYIRKINEVAEEK